MGIFKRIGSLIKSNAEDMVTKAEDPEKILNQTITDMATQLIEAKKKVAEAISDEKRLRKQWESEVEAAHKWKERATMAVRASDDALAKEALTRRKEHDALSEQYQKQWEAQKDAIDALKGALRSLNDKVEAAKRKRNLLIAKKKRADAQKAIQENMSSMTEEGAFETFERMERRIEQTEAEAESAAELAGERTGDNLSERLDELQATADGDMELLALKEELGLLGSGKEDEKEAPQLEAGAKTSQKKKADKASEAEDVEALVDEEASSRGETKAAKD